MAGFHIPPLITNTFIRTQLTSYNIKRREVRQLTLIFISGKRTNRCHGKPNRRTKFQKAEFDSYFCLSHVLTLTFGEMLRYHHSRNQLIFISICFRLIVKTLTLFNKHKFYMWTINLLCHGSNKHFDTQNNFS